MTHRYFHSEEFLKRALETVPLGSQTFSKSKTQFPVGVSPLFIEKGQGARVWDLDGNTFFDFINGLLSVLLGYCDRDVDEAVKKQMQSGVTFSLPHRLEAEVSEMLVEMIPSAEMVRFGKNGSDATSAAVRIARAYTGRDHVAVCGYHGWQDWYIGSTARNLGVPASTQALTHTFAYNDIESLSRLLDQHQGQIAAVVMEPMNTQFPENDYLHKVRELADQHGCILVFDETITGFRFHTGGAQALFGVTPDLSTFGKGMGNGYPISAVVGRKELMMVMEDIFFSSTFGGETLSLAASKAVLTKVVEHHVPECLNEIGQRLIRGAKAHIQQSDLEAVLDVKGHPSWTFLTIAGNEVSTDWEIRTFLLQELFARGILTIGTHNLSYSHDVIAIDALVKAYGEVFAELGHLLSSDGVKSRLNAPTMEPLFKVR